MKKAFGAILIGLGLFVIISSSLNARNAPNPAYLIGMFLPGFLFLIFALVLRRDKTPQAALKAQARATEQEMRAIEEKVSQMQAGGRRRSSLLAAVDTGRCTSCGACAAVCPMGAIAVDAAASVETSNCTGCGLCVDECPQEAITLKRI